MSAHSTVMQPAARLGWLDLFKAVACNLIVLHHLAFYGPMTDWLRPFAPDLLHWFSAQARIAVQVFLVIGGFLAAKTLAPQGLPGSAASPSRLARRYLKLAPPYAVAIAFAVGASWLAGLWMTHRSISEPPTTTQLAAHVLLLQDIFGYPALSAGAWYVAIDFQLFALLTLLLWLAGRLAPSGTIRWILPILVAACTAASLFYFNRDSDWDVWGVYFFGSYGLGVLAWWVSDPLRAPTAKMPPLTAMLALALTGLALEFRMRIAIALLTALALAVCGRSSPQSAILRSAPVAILGRISYSVFLIHFPVCLIMNAVFTRFAPALPSAQAIGVLLAWSASLATGAAFHRWVEKPLQRLTLFTFKVCARMPIPTLTTKQRCTCPEA